MNIPVNAKLLVLTKPAPSKARDGDNFFYKIGVEAAEEVGMMNCNKDVYDLVDKGKVYEFTGTYNITYKSLRFVHAHCVAK